LARIILCLLLYSSTNLQSSFFTILTLKNTLLSIWTSSIIFILKKDLRTTVFGLRGFSFSTENKLSTLTWNNPTIFIIVLFLTVILSNRILLFLLSEQLK